MRPGSNQHLYTGSQNNFYDPGSGAYDSLLVSLTCAAVQVAAVKHPRPNTGTTHIKGHRPGHVFTTPEFIPEAKTGYGKRSAIGTAHSIARTSPWSPSPTNGCIYTTTCRICKAMPPLRKSVKCQLPHFIVSCNNKNTYDYDVREI